MKLCNVNRKEILFGMYDNNKTNHNTNAECIYSSKLSDINYCRRDKGIWFKNQIHYLR